MSDSEESEYPIVIDPGSYFIKAGFAADDIGEGPPRAIFPACTGRPFHRGVCGNSMAPKDTYVGDEALSKAGILNLSWPIHRRKIGHLYGFEKILHHTFYNELRIQPEEFKILVAEPPNWSQKEKENVCQLMLDEFNVLSYHPTIQQPLALLNHGKTTGIVVDIGYNTTFSVPVYEGNILTKGILNTNYGGEQVSVCLEKFLSKKNFKFETYRSTILENIKTKCSCSIFTSQEYNILITGFMKRYCDTLPDVIMNICCQYFREERKDLKYKLPDGNIFILTNEDLKMPVEVMFNPNSYQNTDFYENRIRKKYFHADNSYLNNSYKYGFELCRLTNGYKYHELSKYEIDTISLSGLLNQCIEICQKLDLDEQKKREIIENIVLCGGGSMFDGLKERLQREIIKFNKNINIQISASKNRQYDVWKGGAVLSTMNNSLDTFWITREQYDEIGPSIVSRI